MEFNNLINLELQTKNTYLITGGLGYIGSHICLELLKNENDIIIIDNLSNSKIEKLDKIQEYKRINKYIGNIEFHEIDLTDYEKLDSMIENYINKQNQNQQQKENQNQKIDIIIHLAGLKAVAESIDYPIKYYENNIVSTLNLTKIMEKYNISNLIFSSSATVYGTANVPYIETSQTGIGITNPYGRSKFLQEEILKDI